MRLSRAAIALVVALLASLAASASLKRPTMLCAATHKRRQKTVHLHDIARNDSRNEYFAGGQDEEGRGSATVLIYPDEDKFDANGTKIEEAEAEPEPKPSAFKGEGRKL